MKIENANNVTIEIRSEDISKGGFAERWGTGVQAVEYTYRVGDQTKKADFQDLMVLVSQQRATAVEHEITPLSTDIQQRNQRLKQCSDALAYLRKLSAKFGTDTNPKTSSESTDKANSVAIALITSIVGKGVWPTGDVYKSQVDETVQKVQGESDRLNNLSQSAMTRLQSLVDKRDQSYSTATTLMTAISDTRSNTIRSFS